MNSRTLPVLSILDARVITGPTRGLIHLARTLPRNAWLHLAVLSPDDQDTVPEIARVAGAARLTVHRLVERGAFDPTVIWRAREIARGVGARIVQSHSYKPHLIAMGVRALTGIPWVGFHHGWTAENLKVRIYHALDRFTLPHADRIVTVSTHSHRLVLGVGCPHARTVMITNAVDPRDLSCDTPRAELRRAFGLPEDAVVVCAVGRLSHEKGQDVLLEALARTVERAPTLMVALAGDGPDRVALEQSARRLGIEQRVKFLGHQRTVGSVYRACDAMVLPSRSEGMPNALLEAMCIGLPVIATRVGGVAEVATDGETAWLVPSESPDALADALVAAANDPAERARRGALAKEHIARTLSPETRTRHFAALYRQLLGGTWTAEFDEPRAKAIRSSPPARASFEPRTIA